ncbi:MAG: DUF3185 domain-containing protein [Gemmatimonadota bacterium]
MKVFGIILIVLGLVGFATGGFSFTRREEVVDLGPIEISAEERERVPITPIASGAALIAGIVLVIVGSKKRA